ncbi:hypothetical protein [Faecalibacterium sp. An122]|uniref:hypothetical protein n=1 Tax=Faecalibacterium sp. An122 TaxID=1965551 RepID=UPI000B3A57C8|nr:hypothetical protein [Faecalibacterium sp. An122]OUQ37931.1 hypothetical protein B5E67_06775 [Faecalibacterium sp. An122]
MKLKKIVSLALAGILAVSMLTACDSKSNNGNSGDVPPESNAMAGIAATLTEKVDLDKIKFSASNELDNALISAIGNVGTGSIAAIYDANGMNSVQFVDNTHANTVLRTVAMDLIDDLESENFGNEGNVAGAMGKLTPSAANQWDDDLNVTVLYVVNSGVEVENALAGIANNMDNALKGLQLDNEAVNNVTTQRYTYSGAVSVYSKIATEDHGKGLTFIAVQVTRNLA